MVLSCNGIERLHRSLGSHLLSSRDAVQGLNRFGRIIYLGQSIQVSAIGRQRDFAITKQISDSLAHIDPLHDVPAIAPDLFSDFELRRVINDHLQAENRTGFVVHFEPVLFHPVFDANVGKSFEGEIHQITDNVALKASAHRL